MLQAIILNKAGRNISSDEIHWRELFRASEDSLTSTIFGLLYYLPTELFWEILLKSCYDQIIPNLNSPVLEYTFWPRWDPSDTQNVNLVEPDLFIRTEDYDIIIEAKRFDRNQQNPIQWKSEFQAYLNEYGDLNKRVFLIAVGGIYDEKTESIVLDQKEFIGREIQIVKCRWSRILKLVKETHLRIEHSRFLLSSISSAYNVLNDLILGFRIHGYYTGEWFEKTDFSGLLGIRYDFNNNPFEGEMKTLKFYWGSMLGYGQINIDNYNLLLESYGKSYKRSI